MHASPAFRVQVCRFGIWRAGILLLLVAALAAQGAWLVARHDDTPAWLLAMLSAFSLVLVGAASLHLRCPPAELRWDTERWHLGAVGTAGADECAGHLTIALDLGFWMLLRFEFEGVPQRRRVRWLPLQRRGLEGPWHALRCAVYGARPASGRPAGPNFTASPESQE